MGKKLRIGLVQVGMDRWNDLPLLQWHLDHAAEKGVELAVLPETFPFWCEGGIRHADAEENLRRLDVRGGMAFVAGALTQNDNDADKPYNRMFLVHGGEVIGDYAKRIAADDCGEKLTSGDDDQPLFRWNGLTVVPFICADVYGPGDAAFDPVAWDGKRSMGTDCHASRDARRDRYAGTDFHLVTAFAGCSPFARRMWSRRLARLVDTGRPVVFCNAAGRSWARTKAGSFPMGGGHSGVFCPDDEIDFDAGPTLAGLVVVDLDVALRRVVQEDFYPFT